MLKFCYLIRNLSFFLLAHNTHNTQGAWISKSQPQSFLMGDSTIGGGVYYRTFGYAIFFHIYTQFLSKTY